MQIQTSPAPLADRIMRKVARLKVLLAMGGTLENKGASVYLSDLRMDVGGIADMNEPVWGEFQRDLQERMSFDAIENDPEA